MADNWRLIKYVPPTYKLFRVVTSETEIEEELTRFLNDVRPSAYNDEDPCGIPDMYIVIGNVMMLVDDTSTVRSLYQSYQVGLQDHPKPCVFI